MPTMARTDRRRAHRHQWSSPIEDHLFGTYRRCMGLRCCATDPEYKPQTYVQFGDWQIGTARDIPRGRVSLREIDA